MSSCCTGRTCRLLSKPTSDNCMTASAPKTERSASLSSTRSLWWYPELLQLER
jgi:hypothetical protein